MNRVIVTIELRRIRVFWGGDVEVAGGVSGVREEKKHELYSSGVVSHTIGICRRFHVLTKRYALWDINYDRTITLSLEM